MLISFTLGKIGLGTHVATCIPTAQKPQCSSAYTSLLVSQGKALYHAEKHLLRPSNTHRRLVTILICI